jgi:hypothetical protein
MPADRVRINLLLGSAAMLFFCEKPLAGVPRRDLGLIPGAFDETVPAGSG